MSNAYFSLLNFREKAVPELLRWVKDEPVARYYALKAFVAFRRDFATESTDPKNRFLDAALSVLPEVGLGERIQIAQLLGYYREDQARSVLREMIDSDELAVAHSAIVSLARVGESSDALLLARLLDSENAVIRTAACDALDSLLNFHAGTDLVLPADYYAALDKRVSEWKKWLAENKTKLSPKSS